MNCRDADSAAMLKLWACLYGQLVMSRDRVNFPSFLRRCRDIVVNVTEAIESGRSVDDGIREMEQVQVQDYEEMVIIAFKLETWMKYLRLYRMSLAWPEHNHVWQDRLCCPMKVKENQEGLRRIPYQENRLLHHGFSATSIASLLHVSLDGI